MHRPCLLLLALLLSRPSPVLAATVHDARSGRAAYLQTYSERIGTGVEPTAGGMLYLSAPSSWERIGRDAGPDVVLESSLEIDEDAVQTVRALLDRASGAPISDRLLDAAARTSFTGHELESALMQTGTHRYSAEELTWIALEANALQRILDRRSELPVDPTLGDDRFPNTLVIGGSGISAIPAPTTDRLAILDGFWGENDRRQSNVELAVVALLAMTFIGFLVYSWWRSKKRAAEQKIL